MRHSPAHRSPLVLIALMAIGLGLLGVLVWQSLRSASDHLATVEDVLKGYAGMAAERYARQMKSTVGYWIYQASQRLQGPPDGRLARVEALLRSAPDATREDQRIVIESISGVFEWSTETATLSDLVGSLTPAQRTALETALPTTRSDPDHPFEVVHWAHEGRTRTSILVPPLESQNRLVLDLSTEKLSQWLERIYQREPLLPESIAPGSEPSMVYLRLDDLQGEAVFESETDRDPYLTTRRIVGDDYSGLFEGFTVTASIDPALAPTLVIGGLPRSRLPLLIGLILLTSAVLAATVWVVQRDRALSRLRGDFVARVSHELRTPLTQIRMFAETLLLDRAPDRATAREYLQVINREALRLGHLVDNVLTFSGREKSAQSLVLEPVELGSLLDEVIAGYTPLAASRGDRLKLEHEPPTVARVDREAFRQVLINLLDNACKYGPEGQTIRARARRENDRIVVLIEDGGPGIPDADKERVWQPYQRLDRDDRRAVNGTGIGLSVVRDLIVAMGGDCRVENGERGGARFLVSVPEAPS